MMDNNDSTSFRVSNTTPGRTAREPHRWPGGLALLFVLTGACAVETPSATELATATASAGKGENKESVSGDPYLSILENTVSAVMDPTDDCQTRLTAAKVRLSPSAPTTVVVCYPEALAEGEAPDHRQFLEVLMPLQRDGRMQAEYPLGSSIYFLNVGFRAARIVNRQTGPTTIEPGQVHKESCDPGAIRTVDPIDERMRAELGGPKPVLSVETERDMCNVYNVLPDSRSKTQM